MKFVLGIDIGSVAVSLVTINSNFQIIDYQYRFHYGQINPVLVQMLEKIDLSSIGKIGASSSCPKILVNTKFFDSRVCFITASKYYNPESKAVLIVGGEKFGLALFDNDGNYQKYLSNTSCAAGTGSFLDQQAKRLNLSSIQEFSELAFKNSGEFPKIASRCAVFAKTDLIHAQQEGYSLSEICDGLCFGLAKNIVDTVFTNVKHIDNVVFTGGVSLNGAVCKHLSNIIGLPVQTPKFSNLYGALGAAINASNEISENIVIKHINNIIKPAEKEKHHTYKPLKLVLSDYPNFDSWKRYEYQSDLFLQLTPVEVDIYYPPPEIKQQYYLGIDIGSTSTKAVLVNTEKDVFAGFYTRTAGQPVTAVQHIFACIKNLEYKINSTISILACGTTGSGRKFIGKIFGADIILDEITAHARTAFSLDNEVDTIIEIGGQDAKFTTLRNGMVTFSIMNNVCAAGTGSFIEEQAKKLGVGLQEYSERAEKHSSPMSSDRCTVFMERDLNHYLNVGFLVDEILASVLHSVRENYLSKVAIQANIGKKIFFQGATAKNRALVASFEQKLQKPIMVSKFCHLTGAIGVAFELFKNNGIDTKFRGLDLFSVSIPVRSEICESCNNHCKLKIAEIGNEIEAYGFLCGRDYHNDQFIDNNSSNFNLIKEYRKNFRFRPDNQENSDIVIGLPAALYMLDDLFLWRKFFDLLKIKTITSENYRNAVKEGKNIMGAEFCAPMAALHGHVKYLVDNANFVFLPVYLEEKQTNKKLVRHYCYYSQYAPAVVSGIDELYQKSRIISPLLYSRQNKLVLKFELYKAIKSMGINNLSVLDVSNAYDKAKKNQKLLKIKWKGLFEKNFKQSSDVQIVFLGRPYTLLAPSMNSNIPEIFARYGIKTYFQDMIDLSPNNQSGIKELLEAVPWKYAEQIFAVADKTISTHGLYPVLVTSFKCTPDSFVIEFFKQMMDKAKKPFLILQLDEHDSSVGYETRIESAIRAFRNHFKSEYTLPVQRNFFVDDQIFSDKKLLKNKILLIPNWDAYVGKLLISVLKNSGIEARLLTDTPDSIRRSMVHNSGQCIPLNIILQNAIDYIQQNRLNPEQVIIWALKSRLSCNLTMFPYFMAKILDEKGGGYEKLKIYLGDITFFDISFNTSVNAYLAYMFGGYLRKIACQIRPYEVIKGQTDRIVEKSIDLLSDVFEHGKSKEEALKKIIAWFEIIEIEKHKRSKVAIFGDLYARDNDILNQNLVRTIENNGGEVLTTPYSEYFKIISSPLTSRMFREGQFYEAATIKFFKSLIPVVENKYLKYFRIILKEPESDGMENFADILERFNTKVSNNGEASENILKIAHLSHIHKDISLFVQTNPSYCCPSLITEAMTQKIEEFTGVPVVTIEYDGTNTIKNEDIIPFLKFAK